MNDTYKTEAQRELDHATEAKIAADLDRLAALHARLTAKFPHRDLSALVAQIDELEYEWRWIQDAKADDLYYAQHRLAG